MTIHAIVPTLEFDAIANAFAYLALFGWPLVCVVLFNRLSFEKAVVWSMLGGYMLLPSGLEVDGPLLPPVDKMSVTALGVLVLCWVYGGRIPRPRPSYLLLLFAVALVVAPMLSSFTNSYELQTGGKSIPGFYPLTALKFAGRNLLLLVPMYIGFRYLTTDKARAVLLTAIPTAMLFYSLPMLFEIRMSPQLHRWIYGYFPHASFAQQIRDGGFRPVVFFSHGLALALFTAVALLAALVLVRSRTRIFGYWAGLTATYLSGLLLLCKSLGPTLYAVALGPVVLLTKPRTWVKIGCAASLFVCAYPLLRSTGHSPIDAVTSLARSVSADRAASFQVRAAERRAAACESQSEAAARMGRLGSQPDLRPVEWSGHFGDRRWLDHPIWDLRLGRLPRLVRASRGCGIPRPQRDRKGAYAGERPPRRPGAPAGRLHRGRDSEFGMGLLTHLPHRRSRRGSPASGSNQGCEAPLSQSRLVTEPAAAVTSAAGA